VKPALISRWLLLPLAIPLAACGSSDSSSKAAAGGTGGSSGAGGGAAGAVGGGGTSGSGGTATGGAGGAGASAPDCADVVTLATAYKDAHSGNGGKDWDINAKTPAEIAADPAAQQLLALCAADQRPLIPLLAWEYGGSDHPWINPDAAAPAYCVYIPANPSSAHWQYDAGADHVTADVSVRCPDQNPCKAETGANQVMSCLGDPTNIEIFVDLASFHDGTDAGLSLSNASTDLNLVLTDGSKVHMYTGL
jgi:hypothetical protein